MRYLLIVLILTVSCVKTEVLNAPEIEQIDTVRLYKPHKPFPPKDTIQNEDTTRVPINWNPSVEDWINDTINISGD